MPSLYAKIPPKIRPDFYVDYAQCYRTIPKNFYPYIQISTDAYFSSSVLENTLVTKQYPL